jgi:hypothetical protein
MSIEQLLAAVEREAVHLRLSMYFREHASVGAARGR